MKITKKLFLLFLLCISIILSFPNLGNASMPGVYPTYGYNPENNICNIKQFTQDSSINENVIGDYWSLRACRFDNPQIIFNTGLGIIIWLGLLILIILFHYVIYPKIQKRTRVEKAIFAIVDLLIIEISLFFLVLIDHYYLASRAFYDYPSDIDHIIYTIFISPNSVPMKVLIVYLLISLVRGIIMYRRELKKRQKNKKISNILAYLLIGSIKGVGKLGNYIKSKK